MDIETIFREQAFKLVKQANYRYGMMLRLDRVEFYPKGACAGRAGYDVETGKYYICLNREAIELDTEDAFCDTLPHEIAHLFVMHLNRTGLFLKKQHSTHGAKWKAICRFLGGTGERCHSLNLTPARKTVKHLYVTDSGREVWLSTTKHNRLQRGQYTNFRFLDTQEPILASDYKEIKG